MQTLTTLFDTFLSKIRPTDTHKKSYKSGHTTLRKRLLDDADLKGHIVTTFLQGSYRRATAVRPKDESRPDVDVVVVTNFDAKSVSPAVAMGKFRPFLETWYGGKYSPNDRSYCIEMESVKLDLVLTAMPDAAEAAGLLAVPEDAVDEADETVAAWYDSDDWRALPLLIPDRKQRVWQSTHPLAQVHWTWAKNSACNGHYVNVVKAIKWWRKEMHTEPPYPKSYPLEHLIGQACPEGIGSVAEGITLALERIAEDYKVLSELDRTPYLQDHGVEQNVLARVPGDNFSQFHRQVTQAAKVARAALDAATPQAACEAWQRLLGEWFPDAGGGGPGGGTKGGFTPRTTPTTVPSTGGRYA